MTDYSPQPLDAVLSPEQREALAFAKDLYNGETLVNAAHFAGALGLSESAQTEFLEGIQEHLQALDYTRTRAVADHLTALADALSRPVVHLREVSSKPTVAPTPLPNSHADDIEVDTSEPVDDGDPVQQESAASNDYENMSFDDLAELLPGSDPALDSIDRHARISQNNILGKIFGSDKDQLLRRLPLTTRQQLMGRLMDAYMKMKVSRITAQGKQERYQQMKMLFDGKNSLKIAEQFAQGQNAINRGLNTVVNSFQKPRLMEPVGLDLEAELRSVVIQYLGPVKQQNIDLTPHPVEDDIETALEPQPTDQRFEAILAALSLNSRAEAEAMARIFDSSRNEPPYDDDAREVRELLQSVAPLVNTEARDASERFTDLEQSVLWGVIGRTGKSNALTTAPRSVKSVRSQRVITTELSRHRMKIEEVIDKALGKIVSNRNRAKQSHGLGAFS